MPRYENTVVSKTASARVPLLISQAVGAVINGDMASARNALRQIDFDGLRQERLTALEELPSRGLTRNKSLDPEVQAREEPKEALKREVFERDSYTCWLCQKKTMYAPVLMALSARFDDLMPYRNTNWKPWEDHVIYWTCTASWDHLIPVARGGSSTDLRNIITSCYQCNDVCGDYLVTEIGWTPVEPARSNWLGQSEHLEELYAALGYSLRRAAVPRGTPLEGRPPVGALIRATIPNKGTMYTNMFLVEAIDEENAVLLRGMWRVGAE
jgi:5-methylcytosine-specific restriction endonuclease McrA